MTSPAKVLAAALALFICIVTPAMAVDGYCSRPVRVALFEFGVLYRATTDDGIDPRLLDAIKSRTGCQFERVVLPATGFGRSYRMAPWTLQPVPSLHLNARRMRFCFLI